LIFWGLGGGGGEEKISKFSKAPGKAKEKINEKREFLRKIDFGLWCT